MAGLYFHIPFCKQACHYCDFHFSTQLKLKPKILWAMTQELRMRSIEIEGPLRSIYFGGGTPSIMMPEEIEQLIKLSQMFSEMSQGSITPENDYQLANCHNGANINSALEITLEVNPDDVTLARLRSWKNAGVNRLSLGVQSFSEKDLCFMNRAHNVRQAIDALNWTAEVFENYSVDLIYGIPLRKDSAWKDNLALIQNFAPVHLSCYALTREPKTAMDHFINQGVMPELDEQQALTEYRELLTWAAAQNYENYEFSNFAKPGFESINNIAYWSGRPYLGIGPSAHSYKGTTRSWNVANNIKYIKAIEQNKLPIRKETLSSVDQYNEFVMTRLRTAKGIEMRQLLDRFDQKTCDNLLKMADRHMKLGHLVLKNGCLKVTSEGKFLTDGLASDLFLLNLGS